MSTNADEILQKLKQLPQERLAEVEDFVDFLRMRNDDQRLTHIASKVSEPSFAKVWDNDEDAAYDKL